MYVVKPSFIVQEKLLRHEKYCLICVKEKLSHRKTLSALVYIFAAIYCYVHLYMLMIYVFYIFYTGSCLSTIGVL